MTVLNELFEGCLLVTFPLLPFPLLCLPLSVLCLSLSLFCSYSELCLLLSFLFCPQKQRFVISLIGHRL